MSATCWRIVAAEPNDSRARWKEPQRRQATSHAEPYNSGISSKRRRVTVSAAARECSAVVGDNNVIRSCEEDEQQQWQWRQQWWQSIRRGGDGRSARRLSGGDLDTQAAAAAIDSKQQKQQMCGSIEATSSASQTPRPSEEDGNQSSSKKYHAAQANQLTRSKSFAQILAISCPSILLVLIAGLLANEPSWTLASGLPAVLQTRHQQQQQQQQQHAQNILGQLKQQLDNLRHQQQQVSGGYMRPANQPHAYDQLAEKHHHKVARTELRGSPAVQHAGALAALETSATTGHNWEVSNVQNEDSAARVAPPIEPLHWASTNLGFEADKWDNSQLMAAKLAPTTPSLNRQLAEPPQQQPLYEFNLIPTSALQLEPMHTGGSSSTQARLYGDPPDQASSPAPHFGLHGLQASEPVVRSPTLLVSKGLGDMGGALAEAARQANSSLPSSRGERQLSLNSQSLLQNSIEIGGEHRQPKSHDAANSSAQGENQSSGSASENGQATSSDKTAAATTSERQPMDKGVEPRQRRRLFNRILKKAEWNYLFLELSKVFLRYFLDLALKDIIGKQSGGLSSSSSDSSTTGRKKLDAQSELADLLREFVKTAISNI